MPDPTTNPDIRLTPPPLAEKGWDRLEWWHKTILGVAGAAAVVFGAGIGVGKLRSEIVTVDEQKTVDERQDLQIRAILDDSGRMHVTLDDLHDEVRGMRIDLRYFDPRIRGGGLPVLPEETTRPTPTLDPSTGMSAGHPSPPTSSPTDHP